MRSWYWSQARISWVEILLDTRLSKLIFWRLHVCEQDADLVSVSNSWCAKSSKQKQNRPRVHIGSHLGTIQALVDDFPLPEKSPPLGEFVGFGKTPSLVCSGDSLPLSKGKREKWRFWGGFCWRAKKETEEITHWNGWKPISLPNLSIRKYCETIHKWTWADKTRGNKKICVHTKCALLKSVGPWNSVSNRPSCSETSKNPPSQFFFAKKSSSRGGFTPWACKCDGTGLLSSEWAGNWLLRQLPSR